MPKAIAITLQQHRSLRKQEFWQAYGNILFGLDLKTQRFLGLSLLAAILGKILTTSALSVCTL